MAVKFELPFTQTSHVVAFVCTLLVAVALSPVGSWDVGKTGVLTAMMRLAHITAFATWLGTQVWVTFIAGVTMFIHLPRHTFGFIQSKLFPKYFLMGTVLTAVTIVTFIYEHPFTSWNSQEMLQGYSLCVSMVMVLANLVYIEPTATKVNFEKHKLEKEQQAGDTIGKLDEDKLKILNQNPRYVTLSKKFVWLHSLASIANLVALSAQALHLWYLAGHLTSV